MSSKSFFPKSDPSVRIEYKLFEITILLTIGIIFLWSILSFVFDYSNYIKIVYLVALSIYFGIFIAYRFGVRFTIVALLYYGLGLLLLSQSWLQSGGLSGMILHMLILIYISGLLVLPLKAFLLFTVSSILMVAGFSYYEIQFPDSINPYLTELARVKDLAISSQILLVTIAFCLFIFKRSFLSDRNKLKAVIAELEVEKENAKSADRSKSQFLTTISHEMRTPLNGIVGITQLLQNTELNSEQSELVRNLSYSSRMLHSIISDVLDLTLIEGNKLIINENEIDLAYELSQLMEVFKPFIAAKSGKIDFSYEHDTSVPKVILGDIIRLKQILINLINNAIKFTEEGFVKVNTEVISQDTDHVKIKFSVEDSGVGVKDKNHQFLFSKFFKADSKQLVEGTGLGLSIVKNLAEAMGGAVGFRSKKGEGSTFYFEISFKTTEIKQAMVSEDIPILNDFEGLSILVAEDQPINQMVAKKMLATLGITNVDIAENGMIAVQKCIENTYDIVLMDVQMPEMDGIEATMKILESIENTPPVIIAVTANVLKEELEKCLEAGMTDFVSKPFTGGMLRAVFSKHLID